MFVSTEEDFLLSQASLLEQVSNMQPLLDSTYIRGEFHLAAANQGRNQIRSAVLYPGTVS